MQPMKDDAERDLVIKTLIAEGIGEGLDGMVAIAETIRNRAAQRGWNPGKVVTQKKQYSLVKMDFIRQPATRV